MSKAKKTSLPVLNQSPAASADPYALPAFNGVSVNKIEIEQNGDVHVTFDLPTPNQNHHYRIDVQGKRSFDLYEDPELRDAAQALFKLLRARIDQVDPERAVIDCMKCKESNCCREYDVFVTDKDVDRLAEHLGIEREVVERDMLTAHVDWTGDFRFHLAQNEDEQGGKCVFLARDDKSGAMRCSVYEGRPQLCRDFDHHDCTLFDSGKANA